ncbi:hypothetical protein E2C01_044996 [Portunus trituberculatus]|uniref:Reverse transcriptase domain-containing protein n=1 Tax=Portunus trituberculatus TaxID=210409 RepID=A0A5B7FZW0_PORTR|nr:hypothetical protein [Portunus trituberculatus]
MGPDGVSGWALKECKDELLEPIWEVVTSSLKEGRVPLEWMRANIISLFKGGKSTEPLNYRPMSLTKKRWMGGHCVPGHKKGFDKVPHSRLPWKLQNTGGLRETLLDRIRDYLKDREMRTVIRDTYSSWSKVTRGVPQGSDLGVVIQ